MTDARRKLRVLVCGGRDYNDRNAVILALDNLSEPTEEHILGSVEITVIHGDCPTGADLWAEEWSIVNWSPPCRYPADWQTHGRAAGPIRNQQMIDEGKPDLVLAFPGGRGTADMVRRANRAGIEVRHIGGSD